MKIAVPVENNKLCSHFGHCASFAILDVEKKEIRGRTDAVAPPHEPGLLPRWLSEKGVDLVLAGGMGGRAKNLFAEKNIQVVVGAPSDTQESVVLQYLNGKLQTTTNTCTHDEGHVCGH